MNFIKKIFDEKIDELVHLQFQKFSKGEFKNKALIEVKKSKKKATIKTSSEFANELVRTLAEKLGDNQTNVSGAIVSTSDLKDEIDYKDIKQFQGVKRYLIDKEMTGNEIIELLNKFPKTFFALSFKVGEEILKIKPKAPKSGKPGKGDEKPKIDFCSLKTEDNEIIKEFVFEKDNFSKVIITHDFIINSIEIPEELKGSDDFARIREESKRVGKIIRIAEFENEEIKSEKEFKA